MTRRLELAFRSLERMRRFRGHFYNWYDLHDLRVLEPAYVSTVDSGNLAGHLIALRQACLALLEQPVVDARIWRALDTALGLADERVRELGRRRGGRAAAGRAGGAGRVPPLGRLRRGIWPASRAPLQRAEAAVARAELTAPGKALAGEWITWSLRLIEDHRAWDAALEAGSAPTLLEMADSSAEAARLVARLRALAERAYDYAMEMDFRFLFDQERKLFAIGFQQTTHSLDASYYDLLASEARLASFVAIAKNDVPVEHWFRLGRTLTYAAGATALVSWSGSMFEYLMPMLVMRSFPFTLLDQTCHGALRAADRLRRASAACRGA